MYFEAFSAGFRPLLAGFAVRRNELGVTQYVRLKRGFSKMAPILALSRRLRSARQKTATFGIDVERIAIAD
jgi:hypothetical protein